MRGGRGRRIVSTAAALGVILLGIALLTHPAAFRAVMALFVPLLAAAGIVAIEWRITAEVGRLRRSGIAEIDVMGRRMCEKRLLLLFSELGFHRVRIVRHRNEFGSLLIVERLGRPRTAVLARICEEGGTIGADLVRKACEVQRFWRTGAAMVVTNRTFDEQAWSSRGHRR